jgi:hypothetical protein
MCIPLSLLGNGWVKLTAATNIEATREESLAASFCNQSVSYLRKVGDKFFPELLVRGRVSKWITN